MVGYLGHFGMFVLQRLFLGKGFCCAPSKELLSIDPAEELNHFADQTGPASLMACAQAGAVIAVEVLVKEDEILPMRIRLEFLGASICRPPTRLVTHENFR